MLDKNIPPFARASYIGCPWHGLLINGTLTDGLGGPTIPAPTIPQSASAGTQSATQLIKVPGLPEPSRSTEQQALDTEKSYTWKNYALAMGDGTLHGQTLPDDWIIYIDPNKTPWLLTLQYSGNSATVRLDKIFGKISAEPYPEINRDLASLSTGAWVGYPSNSALAFERNSTGSVVLLHYYSQSSNTNITRPLRLGDQYALLDTIYKITISGTGSTDRETLGDGITATFTQYKDRGDMNTDEYESRSIDDPNKQNFSHTLESEIDYDPSPTACPRTTTLTRNYTITSSAETVATSRSGYTYTTLLRIAFDTSDNEVEITAKTENLGSGRFYGGWHDGGTYVSTKVSEKDAICDPVGLGTHTITGETNYWYIGGASSATHYGWYTDEIRLGIYRNGILVDEMQAASRSYSIWRVRHHDLNPVTDTVYTTYSKVSDNVDEVVDFEDWPHDQATLFVQMYSPQVFGVQAVAGDNTHCKLGKVATPNGSDSAHDGVELSHDGLNCVGSHHPVDNTTVWAEPGTLDQEDAAVNFL